MSTLKEKRRLVTKMRRLGFDRNQMREIALRVIADIDDGWSFMVALKRVSKTFTNEDGQVLCDIFPELLLRRSERTFENKSYGFHRKLVIANCNHSSLEVVVVGSRYICKLCGVRLTVTNWEARGEA